MNGALRKSAGLRSNSDSVAKSLQHSDNWPNKDYFHVHTEKGICINTVNSSFYRLQTFLKPEFDEFMLQYLCFHAVLLWILRLQLT